MPLGHVVSITIALFGFTACRTPVPPDITSGFTDGSVDPPPPPEPVLSCPGETQCPCGSAVVDESGGDAACPGDALLCGPTRACTKLCDVDTDCPSGVAGESCHGGRCIVPCDPEAPNGGCVGAGMQDGICIAFFGTHACGYPQD